MDVTKKLKAIKTEAEKVKKAFPNKFTLTDLVKSPDIGDEDAGMLLHFFKAYGFLSEHPDGLFVDLNIDKRLSNMEKAIRAISNQIDVFKQAKKEAEAVRSATFAEKIKV